MDFTASAFLAVDMGWSEYRWIVFIILGLAGFFYVAVPLLILAQQRFEARPRMVRFDVDDYEWPREINRLFTKAVGDLTDEGFEVVDGLFLPSAVQNVKTALVLMVNRAEMDGAMVTAMYAQPVTSNSLKTLYVEFSTRFDDDTVYDTNNSHQIGSFPRQDHQELYQLVRVMDCQALYRVHQAIMARDGRGRSRKVLRLDRDFGGDAVEYLQNAMAEEFQSAADNGYLKLTPSGQKYQPTVKGAFLIVWKELWPWKMVRKMQRDQRAQQLLNELARDGLEMDRA